MEKECSVEVRGVTKQFDDVKAVDDVSLSIRRGEFFSLLGPSGCGKTTLLRMIGGFETPTRGAILIEGNDVSHVPPHRRPANMVFQQYALFPHLTVEKNVAFGLRYKDFPRGEWDRRVAAALALVQLPNLGHRKPDQLSGGQRQRVALARALVLEPRVLLLDEPLGALDQKLRKEMQVELKNLQRKLGITFIFVTHDQEEALTMSDRIAVMNGGKVEQLGPAAEVFERPATAFVAQFMGAGNFFGDYDKRVFIVRPEKLYLHPIRETVPASANVCSTGITIEQRVYQGINTIWIVSTTAGGKYTVCDQNDGRDDDIASLKEGDRAMLCWEREHEVPIKDAPPPPGATPTAQSSAEAARE